MIQNSLQLTRPDRLGDRTVLALEEKLSLAQIRSSSEQMITFQ
jgi:hypothetical protein